MTWAGDQRRLPRQGRHWPSRTGSVDAVAASERGLTLLELLLVVAVIATLAAIGLWGYGEYTASARLARAVSDIHVISSEADLFHFTSRRYPSSLDEIGRAGFKDPWGNPYQFLNIADLAPPQGQMRKDRFLVPINSDYDLYSMGPDGRSVSPLTASESRDDIVRAANGGYIGPASKY